MFLTVQCTTIEDMVLNMKTGNGKVGRIENWKRGAKENNIVKWIRGQRISWLRHLERMEEDRMPKNIFTQELEGTRRREKN